MILIGNGDLYTRDTDNPHIKNGCVAIDGTLIKEIGTTEELKNKYADAEFIDAKGKLIMPAFINTHEHAYSALARGMTINGYNPSNLMDILEGMWWKLDRKLTLEDVKYSALATFLDCIKYGTTTVFDHHASFGAIEGSLFEMKDAALELGIKACLCYEVSDRDGEEKSQLSINENGEFIKYVHDNKLDNIAAMTGIHAAFTVSDKTLDKCRKVTPDYTGFHIHVAEGISDVYDSLAKYNKHIVNRLLDHGILGENTIAAHCTHINEEEMDIIRDTNTMVVHNPESNMGNAVGCGPVLRMFEKGILLGLGTDGYTHDMLESYKVGNIIHKHNAHNPAVAWEEIPTMLFENNIKIAGRMFETPLGRLKEGYSGDVIVCDYDPLTPMSENNLNSHLLFGVTGKHVVTTVSSGKVLMKDREVICVDEKEVYAKCRELSKKLADRINA